MRPRHGPGTSAVVRVLSAAVLGVVAGVFTAIPQTWAYGLLAGWMAGAGGFVAWTLLSIWPMDAAATAEHSVRDDAGRTASDLLVLVAAVASLAAVALLLSGGTGDGHQNVTAGLALASVAVAWATVHTTYTTRYARLYYGDEEGGIDFHQEARPSYRDFVYVAFTVGMAFQVSDTDLKSPQMRSATLRHSLLSYLFGVVIIASTINLVAGLG